MSDLYPTPWRFELVSYGNVAIFDAHGVYVLGLIGPRTGLAARIVEAVNGRELTPAPTDPLPPLGPEDWRGVPAVYSFDPVFGEKAITEIRRMTWADVEAARLAANRAIAGARLEEIAKLTARLETAERERDHAVELSLQRRDLLQAVAAVLDIPIGVCTDEARLRAWLRDYKGARRA